jgi:hypothetical protein
MRSKVDHDSRNQQAVEDNHFFYNKQAIHFYANKTNEAAQLDAKGRLE